MPTKTLKIDMSAKILNRPARDVSYLKDRANLSPIANNQWLPTDLDHLRKLYEGSKLSGMSTLVSPQHEKFGNCQKEICLDALIMNRSACSHPELPFGQPSGRQEAFNLKQWFDTMHSKHLAGENFEVDNAELIVSYALKNLVRQVYVQCAERGELLKNVLDLKDSIYSARTAEMKKNSEEAQQFAEEEIEKAMNQIDIEKEIFDKQRQKMKNSIERLKTSINDIEAQKKIYHQSSLAWQQRCLRQDTIWKKKYFTALKQHRNTMRLEERSKTIKHIRSRSMKLRQLPPIEDRKINYSSHDSSLSEDLDDIAELEEIQEFKGNRYQFRNSPTLQVCYGQAHKETQTTQQIIEDSSDSEIEDEVFAMDILKDRDQPLLSFMNSTIQNQESTLIKLSYELNPSIPEEPAGYTDRSQDSDFHKISGPFKQQLTPTKSLSTSRKAHKNLSMQDIGSISIHDNLINNTIESNTSESSGSNETTPKCFLNRRLLRMKTVQNFSSQCSPTKKFNMTKRHRQSRKFSFHRVDYQRSSNYSPKIMAKFLELSLRSILKRARFSRRMVNKLIGQIYSLALQRLKSNELEESLLEIIYNEFANRYGLKSVSEKKFFSFIASLFKYADYKRPSMMLRLLGIADKVGEKNFLGRTTVFYLSCLRFMHKSKVGISLIEELGDQQEVPSNRAIECAREKCGFFGRSVLLRIIMHIGKISSPDARKINHNGVVELEALLEIFCCLYDKYLKKLNSMVDFLFSAMDWNDGASRNDISMVLRTVNGNKGDSGFKYAIEPLYDKQKFSYEDTLKLFLDRKVVSFISVKHFIKKNYKEITPEDLQGLLEKISECQSDFLRSKIELCQESSLDKNPEQNWFSWVVYKSEIGRLKHENTNGFNS